MPYISYDWSIFINEFLIVGILLYFLSGKAFMSGYKNGFTEGAQHVINTLVANKFIERGNDGRIYPVTNKNISNPEADIS